MGRRVKKNLPEVVVQNNVLLYLKRSFKMVKRILKRDVLYAKC